MSDKTTPPLDLDPEGYARMADAIRKIEDSMRAIAQAGLNRDAIVTLIHQRSRVARRDIEFVLNNLEQFAQFWCVKRRT